MTNVLHTLLIIDSNRKLVPLGEKLLKGFPYSVFLSFVGLSVHSGLPLIRRGGELTLFQSRHGSTCHCFLLTAHPCVAMADWLFRWCPFLFGSKWCHHLGTQFDLLVWHWTSIGQTSPWPFFDDWIISLFSLVCWPTLYPCFSLVNSPFYWSTIDGTV